MTRVALFAFSIAIVPAVAVAQAPPPQPPPAPATTPVSPALVAPAPLPPPGVFPFDAHPPTAIAIPPIPDITLPDLQNIDSELARLRYEREIRTAQAVTTWPPGPFRSGGDAYNSGLNALQQRQYERALEAFDRVIAAKAARTDAALYWKAFSEYRLARTDAALRTIAQLQKEHAQSRYLSDARVLETEVRRQSGQKLDPAQLDDDEIKLLAIQGLERTEQVVPLLEGVLNGANSLNVKRRALYVLALRPDPRAREVLLHYAKGAGNPDLQLEGVRLLVSRRDAQTTDAELRNLYEGSTDTAIRRAIIDAYATRLRVARGFSGTNQGFGGTGYAQVSTGRGAASQNTAAPQELVALYQHETDADLRRHIASVLISIGSVEQVATMVREERDPQTRRLVIGTLAVRNNPEAARALTEMYGSFTDVETREVIISALAGQQNAEALIAIARTESNVTLKTRIVRHLSTMAPRSKPAADYLMEVIR